MGVCDEKFLDIDPGHPKL